jgi:hypothetical protein
VFVGEVTRSAVQQEVEVGTSGALKSQIPLSSFEVRVTSPLVGELSEGDTVVVEQPGGVVNQTSGDVVAVLEGDELLSVGETYLFFSARKESGALSTPPFGRFKVGNAGELTSLPQWKDLPAAQELSRLGAAQGAAAIEEAVVE